MNRKDRKELQRLCKTYLVDYDYICYECQKMLKMKGATETKFINNFMKLEYFNVIVKNHMQDYFLNKKHPKENREVIKKMFETGKIKKGLLTLIDYGDSDNQELYVKLWKGRPWTWKK